MGENSNTKSQLKRFLSDISFMDNLPLMIFVKDSENLNFQYINKAGQVLTGFTETELLGKSDGDFFPEVQAKAFIEKDKEVLKSKTIGNIIEEPIKTKSKGIRFLHTQKVPVQLPNGTQYLLGISQDVTERKIQNERVQAEVAALRAELAREVALKEALEEKVLSESRKVCDLIGAIEESENTFRTVTDAMQECVAVFDTELEYVFVSGSFSRWLDKPLSEVIGHSIEHVLSKQMREQMRVSVPAILNGICLVLDCESDQVRIKLTPSYSSAGKVVGVIQIVEPLYSFARKKIPRSLATPSLRKTPKLGLFVPDEFFARVDRDPEAFRSIFQLFKNGYQAHSLALRQEIEKGSPEKLQREAHALLGELAILGYEEAVSAAAELETLGRAGTLKGAMEVLDRLNEAVHVILRLDAERYLEQRMKKGSNK